MKKPLFNLSSIGLIVASILALIAGIWLAQNDIQQTSGIKPVAIQGAIYPKAKQIQAFEIKNHLNETFTKDNLLNDWSLVFVGYTHCPDICPTTMAVMDQIHGYMKEQQLAPPQIVFLSIDPERDTPELIREYVQYFNPEFIGLTGSKLEISRLSAQLNAVYKKAPGLSGKITDDDYLMDHSSALMLINPDGDLQSILTAPHLPGTIIESIIRSQTYYDAITAIN